MASVINMPKLRAQVAIEPTTLDEEARTFEVRFYSGAAVQRYPMFDEPYELSFSLDKGAVRMERFTKGAPLLDNHDGYGPVASSVLGVIEDAWLAEDGGHARVKVAADRPDILARVKDGVLRNFSMGAVIHAMRDVTEKSDKQKRLLAIDWEPLELSIVPVPADPGAQALSAQALANADRFPCRIEMSAEASANAPHKRAPAPKEKTMKVRLLADVDDVGKLGEIVEIEAEEFDEKLHSKELETKLAKNDPAAARRLVDEEIARKKSYEAEIERMGAEYEMDTVFIARHKKLKTPMDQFIRLCTRAAADTAPEIGSPGSIQLGSEYESLPWRMGQMVEALHARATRVATPEPARQYARFTFAEMAREILAKQGRGHEVQFLNPSNRADAYELVKLGTHTPSDFPKLLGNFLNKGLLPAYQAANPTYKQLAAERTFSDFRAHHFLRPGDFPVPKQVGPGGEFQSGTMGENDEQITAYKYGVIYPIALETLVNDDVGAFNQIASMAGQRAADYENYLFFSTCITTGSGLGPALSDGVVVYDGTTGTSHGNVGASGALSVTLLDEARAFMGAQTSIDGLKLNIPPAIVLTPLGTAGLAERLLAPLSNLLATTTASDNNNWAGKLRPVTDANLTGTRFYVLADPARHPQYVYGSLAGQMGPMFETQQGFDVDAVRFKLRIVFGSGAVDYRAGYSAAGQ
jgi:hypothetical protein